MSANRDSDAAYALVKWRGRYWVVLYKGVEQARFDRAEETNALDFCNGFNAGLVAA